MVFEGGYMARPYSANKWLDDGGTRKIGNRKTANACNEKWQYQRGIDFINFKQQKNIQR